MTGWLKKDGYYEGYPIRSWVPFLISEEDYAKCEPYTWKIKRRGGVPFVTRKKRSLADHILGYRRGSIEYINGDPLDNRRENLKLVSNPRVPFNRRKNLEPVGPIISIGSAAYNTLHQRRLRRVVKQGICALCGKATRTHWSNKSGEYRETDESDWWELCPRCHKQYDKTIALKPKV